MPARSTQPMQPMRRQVAPAILCDITNTNLSRQTAKNGSIEVVKGPPYGNCPASGFAAGLAAAAGAGCGACFHAAPQAMAYGECQTVGNSTPAHYDPMDLEEEVMGLKDPQSVSEYVQDIYVNLQRRENEFVLRCGFLDRQTDINPKMRSILVDWLIEVHLKYKLRPETLFLTVSIIDRYLEKQNVTRRTLQLVGVASMLVAAKYEEIYPPEVKEFVYITDNAYTKDDILKMEMSILVALNFKICAPTIGHFLDRYQRVNCVDDGHRHLMQYVVELSLVDPKMADFAPSLVAAAAALLSNKLLKRHPAWPPAMVKHTQMMEANIKLCAREMCGLLEAAERSPLQAVRRKYSQAKFSCVGKMTF